MVDNTQLIRDEVLKFKDSADFYVAHVIQRAKDKKADGTIVEGDSTGDGQRLLKTWYLDSVEYWDRKLPIMKDIAEANRARLYVLPQVRNKLTVNRVLAKAIIDAIDDDHVRYDHLIRTAVCGCHASREKMWILDVDNDIVPEGENQHERAKAVALAFIADIQNWRNLTPEMYRAEKLFETRNGWGVLTLPFDVRIVPNQNIIMKDAMMLAYCDF